MRSTEEIPACPLCARTPWLVMAGWFLLSLFAGETELLSMVPGPAAPLTVFTLTGLLLGILKFSAGAREWASRIDLRALILFHLVRLIGIYFLFLQAEGVLPGSFAVPAGWGDIVVALGAALILAVPGLARSRTAVLTWNTAAFVDILMVVASAIRTVYLDRDGMAPFTRLPLSFLPTMIVPLIITTHVLIFGRLSRKPLAITPPGTFQASAHREPA